MSMIPGLIDILRENIGYGTQDVQVFEAGRVGIPTDGSPLERKHLAALMTGPVFESKWDGGQDRIGFHHAKGVLGDVLRRAGFTEFVLNAEDGRLFTPGRRANVYVEGREVGVTGELHADLAKELRARDPILVFEIDFDAVVDLAPTDRPVTAPSKFPPVSRDLSVVVDGVVWHRDLESVIREIGGGLVEAVALFDVYRGKPIEPGKKSMTYTVRFRSQTETLTDSRIDDIMDAIRRRLADTYNATFRA